MSFESILQSIADTTDRDQFNALAVKYPSLRAFAEAGEQMTQLQPRLREMGHASLDTAVNELSGWQRLKNDHWDPSTRRWKKELELEQIVSSLRAELADAESRGETSMTAEEIKAIIREEIQSLNLPKATDTEALVKQVQERVVAPMVGRFQTVYTKLTPVMINHRNRFGEDLSVDDVQKVMTEMETQYSKNGGIPVDPIDAYNSVFHEKIEAKSKADREAERKADREAGAKEERERLAKADGARALPIDDGRPVSMGPLKKRILARAKQGDDPTANAKLGSGVTSMHAAQERREKIAAGA